MVQQQLIDYIKECLGRGIKPDVISAQLIQSGWAQATVNQALDATQAGYKQKPQDPHKVRNGILWICSPFILLVSVSLIQFVARLANPNARGGLGINIISLLIGVAAIILIPVGLIVGIMKLSKKS